MVGEQYMFIPAQGNNYFGPVRAHVLRQHLLKRKAKASRRFKQRPLGGAHHEAPPDQETRSNLLSTVKPSTRAGSSDRKGPGSGMRSMTETRHSTESLLPREAMPSKALGSSLVRSMSAARTDPFQVCAKRASPREAFLLDYYVGDLLDHFGMPGTAPFNPCRDICFPTNITSEASFNAMCSFAARHLAMRTGDSQHEALSYRVATIQSINIAIDSVDTRYADSTVLAIIGLIAFDQEAKSSCCDILQESDIEFHLQGLRKILAARGGFTALAGNHAVSWIIHWFDLLNWGKLSAGTTPLSVHAFLAPSRLDVHLVKIEHCDASSADSLTIGAEEFVGMYGSFYRTASERISRFRTCPGNGRPLTHTSVYQPIERGNLIWKILTEPDVLYGRSRKIIALVYLNLSFWQYRNSLSMLHRFLGRISSAMAVSRFASGGPLNAFLWILLTDTDLGRLEDIERVWTAARFLNVYDRLCEATQRRLEVILMQFLTAEDESEFKGVPAPDVFRDEVMVELGVIA